MIILNEKEDLEKLANNSQIRPFYSYFFLGLFLLLGYSNFAQTNGFVKGKSYIIDELGNLYKWDDKQVKEFGTVHDYTLIPSGANIELAQLCKQTYESLDRPVEFSIKN